MSTELQQNNRGVTVTLKFKSGRECVFSFTEIKIQNKSSSVLYDVLPFSYISMTKN